MTYFLNFILDNSNAIDVVLSLALLVCTFCFIRRLSNLENHINDLENHSNDLQEQLRKLSADCRTLKADTERLEKLSADLTRDIQISISPIIEYLLTEIQSFNIDVSRLNDFLGFTGFDFSRNKFFERKHYTMSDLRSLLYFYMAFKKESEENNKLQTPPCLKVKDLNISKLTTVKKTRKKSIQG